MFEPLSNDCARQLMDVAREFASRAYVPYSNFPVGAAVLTDSREIIGGVNIENASFGLTNCGERTAIFTAAAQGHRVIRAVAVHAPYAPGTTPCGACRQVINEFKPADAELVLVLENADGLVQYPFSEILPHAFGPRDLERASTETPEP